MKELHLRSLGFFCAVFSLFVLTSCSGMRLRDYKDARPEFAPERYFAGRTAAWGVFYDWRDRMTRRFTVAIDGRSEGNKLVLDEHFIFDDGELDERHWEITKLAPGKYEGISPDVIGKATGTTSGNAIHWEYQLNLKTSSGKTEVAFDDWMFLLDEQRLFNRAAVSKFGVQVGEVILFFEHAGGVRAEGRS